MARRIWLWVGIILSFGTAAIAVTSDPTATLELKQNYPNPFSVSTEIRYVLPTTGHVLIRVFNSLGTEVSVLVNEKKGVGESVARFDGASFPSGQYTYVLEFTSDDDGGKSKLTRRMNLIR